MLRRWIRIAVHGLSRDERDRWREEWLADAEALEQAGAGRADRWSLAVGIGLAVVKMRLEGVRMDGWMREVRLAFRSLWRRPGFAAVAILTLGLGIGSTTAVVSVVRGVLLEPLPYPEAHELVLVHTAFPALGFDEFWMSPPEYGELTERSRSVFESLGAYRTWDRSIGGGDEPERVTSAAATASLFTTLGIDAAIGRVFDDAEDAPGGPVVALLSWGLWERSFGGDREIIGRVIEVDGDPVEVVGVLPADFDLEDAGVEIWLPSQIDPTDLDQRASHWLRVIGRLRDGRTPADARREIDNLVHRWEEDSGGGGHLPHPERHPLLVEGLQDDLVGDVRTALWVLMGAVGFVLLIACVNVANLLLVRAEDRQREVSVRAALGAGRGRLVQQFLIEGLLLAGAGAALGIVLASGGLRLLQTAGGGELPRLAEIDLDPVVLLITVALTAGVGVVFGLAPARHAMSAAAGGLRASTRTTGSRARKGVRSALVVVETALALVLAVGAGLMLRSFDSLTGVNPGFEVREALTFKLYLPNSTYPDGPAAVAALDRIREELRARPEFASAVVTSELPTEQVLYANDIEFETLERSPDAPPANVDYVSAVSPDYMEVMGLELVAGRFLDDGDVESSVPVMVINETFARTFFGDASPLGQRVRQSFGDIPFSEIVGVVRDVRQDGLARPAGTEIFFTLDQVPSRQVAIILPTADFEGEVGRAAREAVAAVDRTLPLARMRSMEEVLGEAVARSRFLTGLLAGFAMIALLLAAVGTYGVLSYSVSQRSRELGIRMAIGAEAGRVQRGVLAQGLAVAMTGLGIGLIGAWFLTGVLDSLLYEIDARDPLSFLLGPATLALVAVAASWLPARRATRVDPVIVLREE